MAEYLADYLNGLVAGSDEYGEVLAALRALTAPKRGGNPPQLRQATNRVGVASTFAAGATSQMSRSWQISHVPVRKIMIGWANWGVDIANARGTGAGKEVGPGGTATLKLSVEYPRGTFTRVTLNNGATSGTIADGATGESDLCDLGFTIPPFRWFRIAAHVACASGTWNMNYDNACDRGHGDEFQFNGSDNTMNSTVAGSGTTSAMLPLYVLALSDLDVYGLVGDGLLTAYSEDNFPDPSGGRGILGRAIASLVPQASYGVGSDQAQLFVASNTRRVAALQRAGVTRMIDNHGINDFNSGRTSAQVLADKATIRGLISVPWFECTATPKTTGTFATAAGQTVWDSGKNTQRVTHNNAIRAGIAGVESFIDIASLVETSTANEVGPVKDGGVWIGGLTKDGTHHTIRTSLLLQPLVQNLLAAHGG